MKVLASLSNPYACAQSQPAGVGTNGKVNESNSRSLPSQM